MGQLNIACHGADHLFIGVDNYVTDKGEIRLSCGIEHILMDRIALQHTGTGIRRVNESGVVVIDNCLPGGNTRQYALSSAGKTGEEMGLDKPFGHQQVCLDRQTVEDQLAAGGQRAQMDQHPLIITVVNDDPLVPDDLLAEFADQFLFCCASMAAGRDQEGDVGIGIAGADFRQHQRRDDL